MLFDGKAFAPRSSERYIAQLDVSQANQLSLQVDGEIISCDIKYADIDVPPGTLPVKFVFPNGWVFVIERGADINQWLTANQKNSLVNKLEANWFAWVISSLACLSAVMFFYFYVIPWTSEKVAQAVPQNWAIMISDKILENLDNNWQSSELSSVEQRAIRQRTAQHLTSLERLPYPIKVEFRSSDIGANAFALPGGRIVLLDDIVRLAKNQQQLDSIILHEIGHIHHRHMLKKLTHSTLLSMGIMLLTGESSGIVDNLAGLGVLFLSNGYSREAELEADAYAKKAMIAIYGTSEPLVQMLDRLNEQGSSDMPEWISTHPDFEQRIRAAKE